MTFKRTDASGYRFSEANAQCTTPSDMLAVARKLIDVVDPGDAEIASLLH
jgi:hypothetical protein